MSERERGNERKRGRRRRNAVSGTTSEREGEATREIAGGGNTFTRWRGSE